MQMSRLHHAGFLAFLLAGWSAEAGLVAPYTETFDGDSPSVWNDGFEDLVPIVDSGDLNHDNVARVMHDSRFSLLGVRTTDDRFVGDWVTSGIRKFQYKLRSNAVYEGRVRLTSGDTVWEYVFRNVDQGHFSWRTMAVEFDATWSDAEAFGNGWLRRTDTEKSFTETMSSIELITILPNLFQDVGHIQEIDNILIVPSPASLAMCGLGVLFGARRSR